MFDHSIGAEAAFLDRMSAAVAREAARLGTTRDGIGRLSVSSPGVLAITTPEIPTREVALFVALARLRALPNGAGASATLAALSPAKAREAGPLMPYPRNSPSHVQVGDIVGTEAIQVSVTARLDPVSLRQPLRVARIVVGPGLVPVEAVRRDWPGTVTVETVGRRGPGRMDLRDLPAPVTSVPPGRETLPHLRRVAAQAGRLLERDIGDFRRGQATPRRLMETLELATCARRLVEVAAARTAGCGRDGPEGEAAFLRATVRGIDDAIRPVTGTAHWLEDEDSALAPLRQARHEAVERLRAVRSPRPDPDHAPSP